eukprot:scaffold17119_cov123-Isochrysis_galbana.AAC.5
MPTGASRNAAAAILADVTCRPLIVDRTSPTRKPAVAAGPSNTTFFTGLDRPGMPDSTCVWTQAPLRPHAGDGPALGAVKMADCAAPHWGVGRRRRRTSTGTDRRLSRSLANATPSFAPGPLAIFRLTDRDSRSASVGAIGVYTCRARGPDL